MFQRGFARSYSSFAEPKLSAETYETFTIRREGSEMKFSIPSLRTVVSVSAERLKFDYQREVESGAPPIPGTMDVEDVQFFMAPPSVLHQPLYA